MGTIQRHAALLLLSVSLLLTGCSVTKKTDQLQYYQQQMSDFAEQVENYTRQIGSLTPSADLTASTGSSEFSGTDSSGASAAEADDSSSSASASEDKDSSASTADAAEETASRDLSGSEAQFLELIDKLAGACQNAADLTVPRDYSAAGTLCKKANNAMQSAKENYHSAFESATFREADFNAAQNDFAEAMDDIASLMQYFQTYGNNHS